MQKPEGEKGIFLTRTDTTAEKIRFGQQGLKDDYYCTFYRDNFYVIATASDSIKSLQHILLKSAQIIDDKIQIKFQE